MPSDLDLERLALGETPADKREELEAQRANPDVARALSAIARSNEDILRAYPAERIAKQIHARMRPRQRRWVASASAVAVFALVAAIGALLLRPALEERTKGLAPQLRVFRQSGAATEELKNGQVVRAGDVLQLGYVAAGARHGLIVSIDGAGALTRHFPKEGATTALSEQPGTVMLETAYELDDAPGFERFFFISSREDIDAAAVTQAIRALREPRSDTLQLPRAWRATSLRLDRAAQ